MTLPETRHARNNGLHVAYQLVGDGPVDVVLTFDKRGTTAAERAGLRVPLHLNSSSRPGAGPVG